MVWLHRLLWHSDYNLPYYLQIDNHPDFIYAYVMDNWRPIFTTSTSGTSNSSVISISRPGFVTWLQVSLFQTDKSHSAFSLVKKVMIKKNQML